MTVAGWRRAVPASATASGCATSATSSNWYRGASMTAGPSCWRRRSTTSPGSCRRCATRPASAIASCAGSAPAAAAQSTLKTKLSRSQQRSATRASGGFPLRRGDLLCRHDHPGHRVDPDKMIFDGLNSGDVFRGHTDRAAVALIEQRARKVHDSVAHHHVDESDRRPRLALEFRIEPLANGRVTGRPGLRLGGNGRERVQQIGAGYDADELAVAHHEHTVDLVALHEMHDLFERRILGHCPYFRRHHIADLASARLHVLGRKASTHQKFDPPRPLALGPSFGPA